MRILIAALMLAGCANAATAPVDWHYWVDFRAARVETTARATQEAYRSAPYSVVNAYAECSTEYAISTLTPEEKAAANAWAQRDRELSRAEFDTIDGKLKAAGIGDFSNAALERLSGTCPDSIPLFKQYFRA